MFWVILIIIAVVIIVLWKKGAFKVEPTNCAICSKITEGKDQVYVGEEKKVFCKDCFSKIHPALSKSAEKEWNVEIYNNYIAWEEQTREERSKFNPDFQYGTLSVDTKNRMFSITFDKKPPLVLRFDDISGYFFVFNPESAKVNAFKVGERVTGTEIMMCIPKFSKQVLQTEIKEFVTVKAQGKSFSTKHTFDYSADFKQAIRVFSGSYCLLLKSRVDPTVEQRIGLDAIINAAAALNLDNIAEASPENLNDYRNEALGNYKKARIPGETHDQYDARVNAASSIIADLTNGIDTTGCQLSLEKSFDAY